MKMLYQSSLLLRCVSVCLVLVAGFGADAIAANVVFEWNATLLEPGGAGGIPGVSNGDPIVLRVFADNGGADLIDQTWNNDDIIRAELTAGPTGAYVATFFPPTSFGDPVFETDVTGQISNARLVFLGPTNPANFDTLGGSVAPFLGRNTANGSVPGAFLFWGNNNFDTFDASLWTVGLPEPTALALVALGLLALACLRRTS